MSERDVTQDHSLDPTTACRPDADRGRRIDAIRLAIANGTYEVVGEDVAEKIIQRYWKYESTRP